MVCMVEHGALTPEVRKVREFSRSLSLPQSAENNGMHADEHPNTRLVIIEQPFSLTCSAGWSGCPTS